MSTDLTPVSAKSAHPPPPSQNGSAVLRDDVAGAASRPLLPAAGPERCCPCNKDRNEATGSRCKRSGEKKGCPCRAKGKKCINCNSCDLGICENRDFAPADEQTDDAERDEGSDPPSMHPRVIHSDEFSGQGGSESYAPAQCASCHVRAASTSKGLCYACLSSGATPPHRPPPAVPLASPASPPLSSLVQEKLFEAYGTDEFHQRSGLRNTDWQCWRSRLAPFRGCLWDPPDKAAESKRLALLLAAEARRCRVEQQPSERFLICANTVLYRAPDVTAQEDIYKTMERRMDQWEEGDIEQLVQETERNDALLATIPVDEKDANAATLRQFRRLIEKGEIHGRTVREVLESKHPAQRDPDPSCFIDQPLPPLTHVEITANHIEPAARATKRGAGPLGGESLVWRSLLLKFGPVSAELRSELAAQTTFLANEIVPWEQVQAVRSCRLIGLDKQPRVRPIGIGEVPMRMMAKAMYWVFGVDVEIACGEVECVLLVDATNAFNSTSRPAALWNACVLWPRCSRFLFNTYRGHAALYMSGQSAPL
ncbi:unnamed protein product [Vitrella brassicaformis CCMP3155]|uniref:Tesmin/TSO1-like CXC domain-containing protein n=1 Tax=Vitrella brassicaformis (strain CCMP3155) TaxID=1169540 RepID=A0A0G4F604_VITBC|nr:unnamed protein product [Vitrella brassicaformis CCMP3155]|eukprot:CEM07930.1 unnamed protein product [Vitrella brassicaformis CCMP3155]